MTKTTLYAALIGLLAMGCTSTPEPLAPENPVVLMGEEMAPRVFSSQAELRATVRAASRQRTTCLAMAAPARNPRTRWQQNNWGGNARSAAPMPAAVQPAVPQMVRLGGPSPKAMDMGGFQRFHADDSRYSGTNVQHSGIDESHIIKTDGNAIYTVTAQSLFVIDPGDGAEAAVVGSALLPGNATGMLLDDDRLVIIGNYIDHKKMVADEHHDKLTYLAVFDVSSKKHPKVMARHVVEGRFVDARLKDGVAYLVVNARAFARSKPSPVVVNQQSVGHVPVAQTVAFRQPRRRPSFASVHALSLDNPKKMNSKAVLVGNATVVYMAKSNLYIGDTATPSKPDLAHAVLPDLMTAHLTAGDKARIQRIHAVDDDLFTPLEKRDKILDVYCDRMAAMDKPRKAELRRRAHVAAAEVLSKVGAPHSTSIHRFAIDGTSIKVGPSGVVAGHPLNQFAFDEYKGTLRVATTRTKDNAVYALMANNMEMQGELGGLGKNERIYAVRFMGERAYLVTFRQIDPFYVIDLGNPKKPTKLGELKIPGVSKYLHPYGPNLILGVGTSNGARSGFKVSLFDVSNVKSPKVKAQYVDAELTPHIPSAYGHRALLMDRSKDILVVPVRKRRERGIGAVVVNTSAAGFAERGLVFHDDVEWTHLRPQQIEGVVYVDNHLFTKSADILKASKLTDLEGVATVFLK